MKTNFRDHRLIWASCVSVNLEIKTPKVPYMWSVSDICEEKKVFSFHFFKSDLHLTVNQSLLSSWQVLTELLQKECANCNIMTTANWKEGEKGTSDGTLRVYTDHQSAAKKSLETIRTKWIQTWSNTCFVCIVLLLRCTAEVWVYLAGVFVKEN